MHKIISLSRFLVAAAVLSLGVFVSVAHATHSWGNYHWARTANPFTLKLGSNVSSAWTAILTTASVDWSASNVLDMALVPGQSNPSCKATKGRVEVCNKTYGNNGWLGIAQVWASGNHITQGTVKLNDTYFNTVAYNTPAWRQFVTCQEVGHTLGLDHQDENFNNSNLGTCMDYTNDPSRNDELANNLHPNQHDYDELALIYAHLDASNTFSQSSGGGASGKPADDPSAWGKAVRRDAHGAGLLYERDLGNGEKLFTFVTWAR